VRHDVEAALGRQLLWFLGHERDLIGPHLHRHSCHIRGHRHFHVQLGRDRLPEDLEIAFLDVTPVAAEMHRNTLGTCHLSDERGRDRLRLARPARFPQRRDMIDVDG